MKQRKWLGNNDGGFESFPPGKLNARQINDLFAMDDSTHGRVNSLYTASQQPISQLTDDGIVEVQVKLGFRRGAGIWDRRAVIWMTEKSNWIASCVQMGKQDAESQQFRPDTVEGYLWMPDREGEPARRMGAEPITEHYEDSFTGLGHSGAIPRIRRFILNHYVEVNKED